MTRVPLVSDSAMLSAMSRNPVQLMNSGSPSFHSPDVRSRMRGVDAIVNLTMLLPLGRIRSSGSAVRLPTMVIVVSFAISVLLVGDGSGRDLRGHPGHRRPPRDGGSGAGSS